jgi:hypothetical protein
MTRRFYGLPGTVAKHAIVLALAVAAVIIEGQLLSVDIASQPVSWLASAAGVGVLSALLAGGALIGGLFLVAGLAAGIEVLLVTQAGSTVAAEASLSSDGGLYAAVLAAGLLAYLLVFILLAAVRRGRAGSLAA